jgi:hypothetical protein
MDPIDQLIQLVQLDTKLEYEFQSALKTVIGVNPGKKNLVQLNKHFMELLIQINNKIQHKFHHELPFAKTDKYFDAMQINYTHCHDRASAHNHEVLVDLHNQNIILIGITKAPNRSTWAPIKIDTLNKEVTALYKILFIYPEYQMLVTYIPNIKYNPDICIGQGKLTGSNLETCHYALYGELSATMQIGYKNDLEGIRQRIIGQAIKTMWILNTEIKYIVDVCKNYDHNNPLPDFFSILYGKVCVLNSRWNYTATFAHIHFQLTRNEHLDSDINYFYTPDTEPQRILCEVGMTLIKWNRKNFITRSRMRKIGKIMSNIGSTFNPKHIIETICCMEYLSGPFRDLIQPMFEVMLVFQKN